MVFLDTNKDKHIIFKDGIDFIGKHYIVISEDNQVARYYTICQSFHSDIYQYYLE